MSRKTGGFRTMGALIGILSFPLVDTAYPQTSSGWLDTSFSEDGYAAWAGVMAHVHGAAVHNNNNGLDGKIVIVGSTHYQWVLCRFNADGSKDTDFGNEGRVVLEFSANGAYAYDVAIDASDRIVVAGQYGQLWTLKRFLPDGCLDGTFGTGGTVTGQFGGGRATAVKLHGDKILAAGWITKKAGNRAVALARYNSTDGSLDTTFGPQGKKPTSPRAGYLIFDPNSKHHEGVYNGALAISPVDGKTVVGGWAEETSLGGEIEEGWAIMRFKADGSGPDPNFGNNGLVNATGLPGFDLIRLTGVGVQSDGDVIAAGRANENLDRSGKWEAVAARYSATNGGYDWGFGDGGLATTEMAGGPAWTYTKLAVQAGDKLVVGANIDGYAVAFCWDADGQPDGAFGPVFPGVGEYWAGPQVNVQWTLAIGGNGDIHVVGRTTDSVDVAFVLKYLW